MHPLYNILIPGWWSYCIVETVRHSFWKWRCVSWIPYRIMLWYFSLIEFNDCWGTSLVMFRRFWNHLCYSNPMGCIHSSSSSLYWLWIIIVTFFIDNEAHSSLILNLIYQILTTINRCDLWLMWFSENIINLKSLILFYYISFLIAV